MLRYDLPRAYSSLAPFLPAAPTLVAHTSVDTTILIARCFDDHSTDSLIAQ